MLPDLRALEVEFLQVEPEAHLLDVVDLGLHHGGVAFLDGQEARAAGRQKLGEGTAAGADLDSPPGRKKGIGSYIGIPLKNENRIIGVMGFSHSKLSAFKVEEFDLLRTLSHLISAGLEKAALFKKTLELARVDELTGLLNYRVLIEKLEEEVRRKVRTGREFCFIMIDIDDFKRINDRYGHLEGSRLISQMGPLLNAACRTGSTDTCFRYGGEEFSILLAETTIEEALPVAERVRKTIDEYPFSVKISHPFEKVTVSLGISNMGHDVVKSYSELIQEADIALYRSKAMGKNQVTCFSSSLTMPGVKLDEEHGIH